MSAPEHDQAARVAVRPVTRREAAIVVALALVIAAWPVRAGLFHPDRVVLGVDNVTATSLPWRAAIDAANAAPPPSEVTRPRNPALSDQAVVFYPFHRWVARSWIAGDPPLWNPLVYAGAPGLGNPQSGALDPQVALLVLLDALGGVDLAGWGYALLAWLRLAAAGAGAYFLGRRIGLGPPGAALAGIGFGLSGYVVCWLGHPLGHVPPYLPWTLLGLELARGRRPAVGQLVAALALAGAILGGHPETAFYCGFAAGCWALAIGLADPVAGRRGLLALALGTGIGSVMLVPFVEYLRLSAAHAVRSRSAAGREVDLVALGVVLVLLGLVAAWRATSGARRAPADGDDANGHDADGDGAAGPAPRAGLVLGALGLALGVGGALLVLRARGLSSMTVIAFLQDFHGAPGERLEGGEGFVGGGAYLEWASAWLAPTGMGLAFAALLAPRLALRRRRLLVGLALVSWFLTLRIPGLLELYRYVPLVGLGDTVRFGAVSALSLALLAGGALEHVPRTPWRAAAAVTAACVAAIAWEQPPEPLPPDVAPQTEEDERLGFLLLPGEQVAGLSLPLEGWIAPEVPAASVIVRIDRLDREGRPIPGTVLRQTAYLADRASDAALGANPAGVAAVRERARFFRAPYLDASRLQPGHWRFLVEVYVARDTPPAATYVARTVRIFRPGGAGGATVAFWIATWLLLLLAPRGPWWRWGAVVLVLAQGWHFAEGLNPAIPRAEVFPPTKTEAVLADVLGDRRFFGEPGVMPPDTGLVRDLRALDGYDGMDVQTYNDYRRFCVSDPAANALLDWHARGVALASSPFRLLGVGALVLELPLDAPGWELVASPGGPRVAECFVYVPTDPLPRAFCVPRVVTMNELVRAVGSFDPLAVAGLGDDWRPERPFTRAEVRELELAGNNEVRLVAELDGDGLLVLTEQFFPGWTVTVDGEPGEIFAANGIFRGVPLGPGRHDVVFRYRPASVFAGASLAALSLAALAWIVLRGRRRARAASA